MTALVNRLLAPVRTAAWLLAVALVAAPALSAGVSTGTRGGGLNSPDEGGETVPSVSIGPSFELIGSFAEIRGLVIGIEGGNVLIEPVDPQRPFGHQRATFVGDTVLHLDRSAFFGSGLKLNFRTGAGGVTQVAAPGYGAHTFVSQPGQDLRLPMRRLFGDAFGLEALYIDIVDPLQQHKSFHIEASGDHLTLSLATIN